MFLLSLFSVILFFIVSIVMLLSLILAHKTSFDREKSSPFECGFDVNITARIPFSLRYFLLTILFLIFDVEIVLLLPAVKTISCTNFMEWWFILNSFVLILLMGLLYEWREGALEWSI